MHKNVFNPSSLLLLLFLFLMASCSTNKSYTRSKSRSHSRFYAKHHSKKETRAKSYTSASTSKDDDVRVQVVNEAKKFIGKPYKYGGKQPSTGFDCSGFTSYVYNQSGVDLSGPSYVQAKKGKKKNKRDLEVGDLIFFGSKNRVSHVAIIAEVENEKVKVIHSTSSRGVVIDDITYSDYWQKRYLYAMDVIR